MSAESDTKRVRVILTVLDSSRMKILTILKATQALHIRPTVTLLWGKAAIRIAYVMSGMLSQS